MNFIALEDEQEGNGSSHGDTRKTIEANPGKTVNTFGGSLADPKLGLTPSEVSCLRDTADIIIHTGSIEHCLNNYAALKAPNVSATPRLAALALPRSVSLLFVSSNRVPLLAGNTEQVPCSMAKWMPAGDGREGLTATKWVGEVFLESLNKLFTSQTEKAWAVEVHRPCIVVGDQAPNSDSMNAILRYSLQMRCAPLVTRGRGYIDFKPVDDAAMGIIESALIMAQRRTGGVSFKHHSGGVKVPVDKLREHLEQEYEGKWSLLRLKIGLLRLKSSVAKARKYELLITTVNRHHTAPAAPGGFNVEEWGSEWPLRRNYRSESSREPHVSQRAANPVG
ncbi:Tenellin synthetase [Colletotrichum sp. SAR 10_70]|nr:Tenellin synthetase [Colletotrichum sp. SAR 10_71]KAI8204012.1 Tenellin synthetase [Colletotrichum sp. SAR 10_70]